MNIENPIENDVSSTVTSRDDVIYEEPNARGLPRVNQVSNPPRGALWKRAMQKINAKGYSKQRKFSSQSGNSTSTHGKVSLPCTCMFCKDEVSYF